MFWKHRKFRLILLSFASAILLSVSYTEYVSGFVNPIGTEATFPYATTCPMTVPTSDPNSAWNNPQKGTVPAEYLNSDPSRYTGIAADPIVESQFVKKRSLEPFILAVCLITGIVFAGFYCFTRQERPILGPEGDTFGLAISIWLLKYWMNYYPSTQTKILSVLVIMLLITSIRGLLWWIVNRFPLSWSLMDRTAEYVRISTGHTGYLAVHILICIALGICMILLYTYDGLHYFFAFFPLGLSFLMSILFIWKYGKQIEHLQKQIDNLYQNEEITISNGTFEQQETKLSKLHTRIDEAVTTAVTGERFKVELISNVSHDLRTPLTAILGYGELLEKEILSEEGQLQLKKLNQKASYMRELVDSVFELTKVSSGSVPPNIDKIDLIRLLEQTLGLFDDELNAAGLQIRRHYCAETLYLMTDGNRLHQVFANLTGNAIKYALPGSRVHLQVTESADQVSVRMTNIAAYEMDFLPEEVVQRFVRGDKARTSKGSGIGLAIAQTYTQSVGGSFHVEIDGEQFSAIVQLTKNEREM